MISPRREETRRTRDALLHEHPPQEVSEGVVLLEDAERGLREVIGRARELWAGRGR